MPAASLSPRQARNSVGVDVVPTSRTSADGCLALDLRQAVLALTVLQDVDLVPGDDGVGLPGGGYLGWADVEAALGPWAREPGHPVTQRRLRVAVEVVELLHAGGTQELVARLHAHGEPVHGSAGHAGLGWVRRVVPGAALHLGLGISDLPGVAGPSALPPLPTVATALGTHAFVRFEAVRADLERLGQLLTDRLERDTTERRPLVLRPVGTADVVTLLGSRRVRSFLADGDGTGLRAVAVPVRTRGWFDLARSDPAYVGAAWSASEPAERAFPRPVLVTADEVCSPSAGGDVLAGVLAEPAADPTWRQVRWR